MMFTNPYANAVSVTLAGDYNGDGVTDLALSSFANNMVTVLLGKGDGTFTQVPNCCGTEWNNVRITSMTEGDFEHDGRLDLAFSALNPADTVSFLHGNGDGTFTPAMTSVVVPSNPVGLIPADYNQSGELGLAFAATPESYLGVLLPQNWTAPPGLSISPVGSSTATVTAGGSATFTVHVASENGFIGPVHPACSITAPETSCTVSPTANLLTASGYTTYTVSVSTTAKKTASSAVATAPPAPDPALPSRFGIGMVVLALAMIAWVWRRNGALTAASLPLGMLMLLSLTALSCGGRTAPATPAVIDPGTPAGTYTVTLTAADSTGTVTVSTPLTLTVQSAAN